MLIAKGGISRNIDEKNLAKYKAKGYVPAENTEKKTDKKGERSEDGDK